MKKVTVVALNFMLLLNRIAGAITHYMMVLWWTFWYIVSAKAYTRVNDSFDGLPYYVVSVGGKPFVMVEAHMINDKMYALRAFWNRLKPWQIEILYQVGTVTLHACSKERLLLARLLESGGAASQERLLSWVQQYTKADTKISVIVVIHHPWKGADIEEF